MRKHTNTKFETISTNKCRLYFFSGENKIISRSLSKIYKFPRNRDTVNHFCCVFGCSESEKTNKMRDLLLYITSKVCKFPVNIVCSLRKKGCALSERTILTMPMNNIALADEAAAQKTSHVISISYSRVVCSVNYVPPRSRSSGYSSDGTSNLFLKGINFGNRKYENVTSYTTF